MVKSKSAPSDPVLTELITIKRLLVFSLWNSGASQKQMAAALGLNQSQVSRMFPKAIRGPARGGNKGK